MKKNNTYSLMFGKEPSQMISRTAQVSQVLEDFRNDAEPQQVYVITGVRGSGKTVMMTEISAALKEDKNWIVVSLNPEKDMLLMLGAALTSENQLAQFFKSAQINLSFFGFGLTVKGTPPITDIEIALNKMLETLKKKEKKVLVTIDEAVNTKEMRVFISAFQNMIRNNLPIFLLMTGLYENIYELQNEKSLTFLYRAPKIELRPLSISRIQENYQKNLNVSDSQALQMAKLTKGYSFAFQVLGYLTFEQGTFSKGVIKHYQNYLSRYSYEKIWSELSTNDKKICYGIARTESAKIKDIRSFLEIESNQINPYRKRLIRKGILDGSRHGYLYFVLPLFEKFVIEAFEEETALYE